MKTFLLAAACLFNLTLAAPAAPDDGAARHPESVTDLLTYYAKITKKKILLDNTVQGEVSIIGSRDENVNQQIELIEKTLFLNGFTLVDAGDDVVAVLGLGKPVPTVGLPLYAKPEEMPGGQRVFSYLFKLEHRDPREIAGLLSQYLPPSNGMAFTPDRGSRTLIVTGQTSIVRNVIKLMAMLDVPPASPVEKLVVPAATVKGAGGDD